MAEILRRTPNGENWHYTTEELLAGAQRAAEKDVRLIERLRAENAQLLARAEAAEDELLAVRSLEPANLVRWLIPS